MAGTFLCPNTCGFGKIVALELARGIKDCVAREAGESNIKYKARLLQEQHEQFKTIFSSIGQSFHIDFTKYAKKLPSLKEAINKWNPRKSEEKKKYLATFSRANWEKLPEARKQEHSLANCKSCSLRFADIQALFPVKSAVLKGKALANPVFVAQNALEKSPNCSGVLKPTKQNIKDTAKAINDIVSPLFEKKFNISYAEALTKIKPLNLQMRTKNDRRQERRQQRKETRKNIENQMKETAFLR